MPARPSVLSLAASVLVLIPAPAAAAFAPLADAFRTRGEAKLDRGDWPGAAADLGAAVALDPSARNYHARGRAHAEWAWEWGNRAYGDRAIADATRALELDPALAEAHAVLALAYSLRCEHPRAVAAADKAVGAAKSAVALRYRGIVRWRLNDFAGAEADYTAAIALRPRYAAAYQERSDVAWYSGNRDRILADAEKAVELAPEHPGMYGTRSYVRLDRLEFDAALADAEKAVRLAPHDPVAHLAVVEVHLARREYPKAMAACDVALELAPASARVLANRANVRLMSGEPDLALADCRRALRVDPCHLFSHTVAADALAGKMETARAIAACDAALRLYPRETDFLVTRADAKAARGDAAGEAADLRAALELDPRCARAFVSQAATHILAGRHEEALSALDRALKIEPRYPVALGYKCGCLDRLGRTAESEACFAAATRFDRADALFDRGWVRLVAGDPRRGMEDLDAAIRERADVPILLYRSWEFLYVGEDPTRALADAERAVRAAPGNSYAYLTRALCKAAKDDTDGALADLERAVAIDPAYAEALGSRIVLQLEKEKFAVALDDCDDALASDPDDADALSWRAMIFAMLEEARAARAPIDLGNGAIAAGRPQGPDSPRAYLTPGGVRIRGGELPAWLAEPVRGRPGAGAVLAPVQATSADGRFVAVGSGPNVLLYNARGGAPAQRLAGHAFGTHAVCFSPDGEQLVTAGRDGCLRAWDTQTGRELWHATGFAEEVCCLACSPDGRVASGHRGADGAGPIRLWDLESGEAVADLTGHAGGTTALTYRTAARLVSGGRDGMVREWDVRTGSVLGTDRLAAVPTMLAASPNGRTVLYAGDRAAGIAEPGGKASALSWSVREPVREVSFSAGGRRILVTTTSGAVFQFRLPLAFDQGVSDATRAAGRSPKSDLPVLARGMCYLATDRFGQARADFDRAIQLNEKNPESYFRRALVHIQAGENEKAVNDLSAAIGLDPKDGEAHLRRGLLLLKMGEFRRAKSDLDRAIEIDPKLKDFLPADK